MITHKQLFITSNKIVSVLRGGKYSGYDLPSQDWEDIRSKVVIHIFQKMHMYNKSRGRIFPWIYKVADNAMKNALRDLLGDPRSKVTKSRRMLERYTYPIRTKMKIVDRFGNEEIVYEPDMIDEDNTQKLELIMDDVIHDFVPSLNARETKIFPYLLEGKTSRFIAHRYRLSLNTIFCDKHNIKRKFKKALYHTCR